MGADAYMNMPGMDNGLMKSKKSSTRSMWTLILSVAAFIAVIGGGVVVGLYYTKGTKPTADVSSASSVDGANLPDPNNPSKFPKDPRLHKSFYGIAYTPEGALLPECGAKLTAVIRDVQLLSQLTSRIRLYGADCNQTALVLEAIKQTKVEMEVFLGNYVVSADPDAYSRQRNILKKTLQMHGVDNVAGITVGNEFMLGYLEGGTDPDSAAGNKGASMLIADIEDTREMLESLNLKKKVPVGTSDAGSYFNKRVLAAVDYGLSNVHAWFANTTEAGAAQWVFDFFEETNVKPAALIPNKPTMYIAETGWPTASSDISNKHNGPGTASVEGLQTFLDTFVCQANENKIGYFFFEFVDEEWKDKRYGGVEGHWGLFTKDRKLKNVVIPDCASP